MLYYFSSEVSLFIIQVWALEFPHHCYFVILMWQNETLSSLYSWGFLANDLKFWAVQEMHFSSRNSPSRGEWRETNPQPFFA